MVQVSGNFFGTDVRIYVAKLGVTRDIGYLVLQKLPK